MNFSPTQQRIIQDLRAHFGIEAKEISLDESSELFFNLDALNLLTIKLAPDIQALSVHSHTYDNELSIVTAHASLTLTDTRHRGCCKSAQVGEAINGGTIETLIQAANVADGRAARACLRAVGFDPIREFENYLHAYTKERDLPTLSQLELDRRFIHKVRDDRDMPDTEYRTHLSVATAGRFTSTKEMDEATISKTALYFRAIETAQKFAARKAA